MLCGNLCRMLLSVNETSTARMALAFETQYKGPSVGAK